MERCQENLSDVGTEGSTTGIGEASPRFHYYHVNQIRKSLPLSNMLIKGPPYLLTYCHRPKTVATVGTFGSSSTVPMIVWSLKEAGEDGVRKIHQIRQAPPFWMEMIPKSPSGSSCLVLAVIVRTIRYPLRTSWS